MKKGMKLVCMVLTLAMLLGLLAGCGGKGGDDSNGGGSDQTLLLGLIGPMTGDYAHYGTSTRDGAQVAVEEINAAAASTDGSSSCRPRTLRAIPTPPSLPLVS